MKDAPPLPYGRQWVDERDVEAVVRALRGDWLTTGPLVPAFEEALARRAGRRFAVAVNSGTAALHCAYFAAGLGPGDELVTSPLTFAATSNAALHLGARVRFADVLPGTGNVDPAALDAACGPATRVVAPVDYAGHPADCTRIAAAAERRGIAVVVDASHSFGAARDGRPAGSPAHASTASFHPVKPITTAEGGALLTDEPEWRERAASYRNHGIVRDPARQRSPDGPWHYEVQHLGHNFRLPDVLCALGLSQLEKLDGFLQRRREIAARYASELAKVEGLELPPTEPGSLPGWHLYVVRVREAARRGPLFERLRERGIGVQLHYPPVHLHPLYRDLGFGPGLCPVAEDFAARALSLPIHPGLSDAEVSRVVEAVAGAARELL